MRSDAESDQPQSEYRKRIGGSGLEAATSQANSSERSYFMARFYASMGNADLAVENLQQGGVFQRSSDALLFISYSSTPPRRSGLRYLE
jgi:guanyl-specific ribonuclease Sa